MDGSEQRHLLSTALLANSPGSAVDHVLVGLPSFGLGDITLEHYADRIPALEHHYLVSALISGRIPGCRVI